MNIDYNRGVIKRVTPTGVAVFMYRDTPGVYLSAFGTPVAESMAQIAGFKVAKYNKERVRRQRLKEASDAINAAMAEEVEATRNIVDTYNDFSLVEIGGGRYIVKDPDGGDLTPVPLTEKIAASVFRQLSGKPQETAVEPEEQKSESKPIAPVAVAPKAAPRAVPISTLTK